MTVMFNISLRLGTPQQLGNRANHSIQQTEMSRLRYSALNTTECYFLCLSFVTHSILG